MYHVPEGLCECCGALLQRDDIYINQVMECGCTALHIACSHSYEKITRNLIYAGSDVDDRCSADSHVQDVLTRLPVYREMFTKTRIQLFSKFSTNICTLPGELIRKIASYQSFVDFCMEQDKKLDKE